MITTIERPLPDRDTVDDPRRGERLDGGGLPPGDSLAKALGVFSIALGAAQIVAPRRLANFIGVNDTDGNRDTMFAVGLREIASGLGILGGSRPGGWLQARAGGDVMDLALLARAARSDSRDRDRVALAIAAVAGVLVLDVLAARRNDRGREGEGDEGEPLGERRPVASARAKSQLVVRSITVRHPRHEVYAFWRNFENLARFMGHLESVRATGEGYSHWRARAPAGTSVEWDAETISDRPGELIAWRSLPGSSIPNSGQVRFLDAPGGRGTEVHVELRYDPPGGKLGRLVATILGEEPGQQVADDLRRLKQVLETGEVVYSDATIRGGPHPARPSEATPEPRQDYEPSIVLERSADAAATVSSNVDRNGERRTS